MKFRKSRPVRRHAQSALRLAMLVACAGPAVALAVAPIDLRSGPLLFVDDAPVAAQRGMVRTIHPARTRAAPVLESDRPWEGGRVYTYGSLSYDGATRLFRLWYMAIPPRPDATNPGTPPRPESKGFVALATSPDGVHWDKPALGLYAFEGSSANNIVAELHSPAVVDDRFEKLPARRFKLLGYYKGEYQASYSADGVRWQPFPRNPVFKGSDTMSLTQDPRSGEFLAYFKKPSADVPGRVVWLSRSRDFQTWSEPILVFHADEEDNRWSNGPDQRTEVYNMAVLPHAAGFIGLPTMFRVMSRAPKEVKLAPAQSGHDGPIDVQMVTSEDGEHWRRTSPRVSIIPRGAPGTFDGGVILGVTSNCIHAGDETWVCYTAVNTGHGATMPPKQISVGRADWRLHGFASLDAGPAGGRIETVPLLLSDRSLLINADASRGLLRAAVLEADGRPIPGFTSGDFEPVRSNSTRAAARWQGGAVPADRPVRVVIEMTSARLYSLAAAATAP